ncbi:hypothetical protein AB6A40_002473 [Gnathostoma spinigerum]|uniref:FHA domain-containing protein n=1 Tax=Gnathostoma spinigerum TaxID=75299 RepID=A0ABD6E6P5_9BILA
MYYVARSEHPDKPLFIFTKPGDRVFIGRDDKKCLIHLEANAAGVSRIHLSIECRRVNSSIQLFVCDLSTYGTLINGCALLTDDVRVNSGDMLQVGTYRFSIYETSRESFGNSHDTRDCADKETKRSGRGTANDVCAKRMKFDEPKDENSQISQVPTEKFSSFLDSVDRREDSSALHHSDRSFVPDTGLQAGAPNTQRKPRPSVSTFFDSSSSDEENLDSRNTGLRFYSRLPLLVNSGRQERDSAVVKPYQKTTVASIMETEDAVSAHPHSGSSGRIVTQTRDKIGCSMELLSTNRNASIESSQAPEAIYTQHLDIRQRNNMSNVSNWHDQDSVGSVISGNITSNITSSRPILCGSVPLAVSTQRTDQGEEEFSPELDRESKYQALDSLLFGGCQPRNSNSNSGHSDAIIRTGYIPSDDGNDDDDDDVGVDDEMAIDEEGVVQVPLQAPSKNDVQKQNAMFENNLYSEQQCLQTMYGNSSEDSNSVASHPVSVQCCTQPSAAAGSFVMQQGESIVEYSTHSGQVNPSTMIPAAGYRLEAVRESFYQNVNGNSERPKIETEALSRNVAVIDENDNRGMQLIGASPSIVKAKPIDSPVPSMNIVKFVTLERPSRVVFTDAAGPSNSTISVPNYKCFRKARQGSHLLVCSPGGPTRFVSGNDLVDYRHISSNYGN